jgi:hypothetical protein
MRERERGREREREGGEERERKRERTGAEAETESLPIRPGHSSSTTRVSSGSPDSDPLLLCRSPQSSHSPSTKLCGPPTKSTRKDISHATANHTCSFHSTSNRTAIKSNIQSTAYPFCPDSHRRAPPLPPPRPPHHTRHIHPARTHETHLPDSSTGIQHKTLL